MRLVGKIMGTMPVFPVHWYEEISSIPWAQLLSLECSNHAVITLYWLLLYLLCLLIFAQFHHVLHRWDLAAREGAFFPPRKTDADVKQLSRLFWQMQGYFYSCGERLRPETFLIIRLFRPNVPYYKATERSHRQKREQPQMELLHPERLMARHILPGS